jgi:hypothetical protein
MLNFITNYIGRKVFRRIVKDAAKRVPESTDNKINQEIRTQTLRTLKYYSTHPDAIDQRLKELDREWDTERVLEANASTLALAGTILGFTVNRKWFYLPGIVTTFLLQHALQGWCPPLPVIRRMKVRTRHEIDEEKFALKAIRGDFRKLMDQKKATEEKAYKAYHAAAS